MRLVMAVAGAALLACSCASGPAPVPITKSVDSTASSPRVGITISDQRAVASSVLVAEVDSPDHGWIVIRGISEGEPGPLLGVALVRPGITKSLPVRLSLAAAGPCVAYLYYDRGTKSIFEYPGPDEPVYVAGQPFGQGFSILN